MLSKIFTICCVIVICHFTSFSQKDISGTWFVNGRQDLIRTIFQNEDKLIFYGGSQVGNGKFINENTVFVSEWNAYIKISESNKILEWNNQIWTREKQTSLPSIAGEWTLANNENESYHISQDNIYFSIESKAEKINGFFLDKSNIIIPDWNKSVGTIANDGKQLILDNKILNKKNSLLSNTETGKKLCKQELTNLFNAAQMLGRVAVLFQERHQNKSIEPAYLDRQLTTLNTALSKIKWVEVEQNIIENYRISVKKDPEAIRDAELNLIVDKVRDGVKKFSPSGKDEIHPMAVLSAGIHFGSAQALVAFSSKMYDQLAYEKKSALNKHLTEASVEMKPYADCISGFDLITLEKLDFAGLHALEIYSQLLDIGNNLLLAIAINDCCFERLPMNSLTAVKSRCDESCKKYCLSIGKSDGVFNNKTECLAGEPDKNIAIGCDCR